MNYKKNVNVLLQRNLRLQTKDLKMPKMLHLYKSKEENTMCVIKGVIFNLLTGADQELNVGWC
jgi:hypothetical protein